jgi:hypothetical protein
VRKLASVFLLVIALVVAGCGSGEPEPNEVTNAEKGDGPSKDGKGNQSAASQEVDAS